MKIMTGVYTLDEGKIFVNGEQKKIAKPNDAKECGIAMIFQEMSLVNTQTVAENIFLGAELSKGCMLNKAEMNRRAKEVLEKLGIELEPTVRVGDLSVGMSQMVEIAKAVSKDAKILIFDEPHRGSFRFGNRPAVPADRAAEKRRGFHRLYLSPDE